MKNINPALLHKLTEELKPIDTSDLDTLVSSTITKLSKVLGEKITNIPIKFDLDSSVVWGRCALYSQLDENDSLVQEVFINKNLLYQGLEDLLLNNLCHEFCHAYLNFELFDLGYLLADANKEISQNFTDAQTEIDYFDDEGTGHGKHFLDIGKEVSDYLNLKFPITATVDEAASKFIWSFYEDNSDKTFYTVKISCTECDNRVFFMQEDIVEDLFSICGKDMDCTINLLLDILTSVKTGKALGITCSTCGAALTVKIKDKSIQDKLDEQLFQLMLMRLKF